MKVERVSVVMLVVFYELLLSAVVELQNHVDDGVHQQSHVVLCFHHLNRASLRDVLCSA